MRRWGGWASRGSFSGTAPPSTSCFCSCVGRRTASQARSCRLPTAARRCGISTRPSPSGCASTRRAPTPTSPSRGGCSSASPLLPRLRRRGRRRQRDDAGDEAAALDDRGVGARLGRAGAAPRRAAHRGRQPGRAPDLAGARVGADRGGGARERQRGEGGGRAAAEDAPDGAVGVRAVWRDVSCLSGSQCLCTRDDVFEEDVFLVQSRSQYVHHFCDGVTTLINHISITTHL
mmetsp:Transcript_1487/g.4717  ORF Transcript_1487/g.4717 Transcript_1487/m.4717 type:complete len:232 (+) Transcript_1487:724-1419(+)